MNTRLKAVLEATRLEHLLQIFTDEGIEDDILTDLSEPDLQKLGVNRLGDRKRLLSAFHRIPMVQSSSTTLIEVSGGIMPEESESKGVKVKPFSIGKYPVMLQEWEWNRVWGISHGYELDAGQNNGSFQPITRVSWYDAVKWCNAKSEHEALQPVYTIDGQILRKGDFGPSGSKWIGRDEHANGYRLPLEVEWEWAARGGVLGKKRTPEGTPPGSGILDPDPIVNKVLSIFYNQLGIYDITSNMWEWCWDRDETGAAHRIRASIEDSGKKLSNGSHRISRSPDTRYSVLGFRLARNL